MEKHLLVLLDVSPKSSHVSSHHPSPHRYPLVLLYMRLLKFEISPGQITPGETLNVLAYMGEGD